MNLGIGRKPQRAEPKWQRKVGRKRRRWGRKWERRRGGSRKGEAAQEEGERGRRARVGRDGNRGPSARPGAWPNEHRSTPPRSWEDYVKDYVCWGSAPPYSRALYASSQTTLPFERAKPDRGIKEEHAHREAVDDDKGASLPSQKRASLGTGPPWVSWAPHAGSWTDPPTHGRHTHRDHQGARYTGQPLQVDHYSWGGGTQNLQVEQVPVYPKVLLQVHPVPVYPKPLLQVPPAPVYPTSLRRNTHTKRLG